MPSKKPLAIDRRLINTVYAEGAGGDPTEIAAIASVFLNRVQNEGYEKALKGSSAYNKKSPQYKKAATGDLTPYEQKVYSGIAQIVTNLAQEPSALMPFTHMENVRAFGDPSWAKSMARYVDIGRQRFYTDKAFMNKYSSEIGDPNV